MSETPHYIDSIDYAADQCQQIRKRQQAATTTQNSQPTATVASASTTAPKTPDNQQETSPATLKLRPSIPVPEQVEGDIPAKDVKRMIDAVLHSGC